MERRKFSREFKLEAVKLVVERGVGFAQAARDLDLHVNVLRKWVREQAADPQQSFPGKGQMKPEQLEIDRLRKEVGRLKAERDILKKATACRTQSPIAATLRARFAARYLSQRAEQVLHLTEAPPGSDCPSSPFG